MSAAAKENAWQQVVHSLAAVRGIPRSKSEIKKKWSDMKTKVKGKAAVAKSL